MGINIDGGLDQCIFEPDYYYDDVEWRYAQLMIIYFVVDEQYIMVNVLKF